MINVKRIAISGVTWVFLTVMFACNSNTDEDRPTTFASEAIDAMQVESLKRNDSISQFKDSIIDKMGGYNLIKIESNKKCNLVTGYYSLNNVNVDPADLNFLSKHLAMQLIMSTKKDPECDYPLMSSAFIYARKEDYDESFKGDHVAMCSIGPSNYSGDVFINHLRLRYLKSQAK